MASGYIKLANKLPRINPPLTLPNGDPNPYCYPDLPYVNGLGTFTYPAGYPTSAMNMSEWLYPSRKPTGKIMMYVEIDETNVPVYFSNMLNVLINEPGAYIIEQNTGSLITYTRLMFADAMFNPDPGLQSVPEGPVTTSWVAGQNGYASQGTGITKMAAGPVRISAALVNNYFFRYCGFMDNTNRQIKCKFVIDYIPPGVVVKLAGAGVVQVDNITDAGTYEFIYTDNMVNQWTGVGIKGTGNGDVIVSRMEVSVVGQPWIGNSPTLRCKLGALWLAQSDIWDAVINPAIITASNQIEHPPFSGKKDPMLGFNGYVPPSGLWKAGDTIYNRNAATGKPTGWRCITPGNPGIWLPLAGV